MALSQSSNYVVEQRDKLFHNKYKYRIKFNMNGASRTYWHRTLLSYEKAIQETIRDFGRKADPYDAGEIDRFMRFKRKYLLPNTSKYSNHSKFDGIAITVQYDKVTVFANESVVVNDIKALGIGDPVVTEAVVSIPRGIMYFAKPPKYTHRLYMKSKRVDEEFRLSLVNFLKQYPDIVPCGALKRYNSYPTSKNWHLQWLSNSYFVDFNGDSYYTLMLMYFGAEYLGKFYELHERPA